MRMDPAGGRLTIRYCTTCNYRPQAARLAMRLREAVGLSASFAGSTQSGAFEIDLDGDILFSKIDTGRFPDPDAICAEVARRLGSGG